MGSLSHRHGGADPVQTTGDSSEFSTRIEPYRRELQLHCYRLLGSLEDAEDLVQETMLRAWRHHDTFGGRATLRTWLYTIATNACLDILKTRQPRTLPAAAFPVSGPRTSIAPPPTESIWLEPCPDLWLAEATDYPEAHYSRRESVSLAFLAAIQLLPPRQRAILLLSDVLDWHAREIARLLLTTVSAVNSALHRARVTLETNYHSEQQARMRLDSADGATSELLRRYVTAWETDDIDGLVALLKEDGTMSMPPSPSWVRGRDAIRAFLSATAFGEMRSHWHLYRTAANGQPAFAVYRTDASQGPRRAFGIQLVAIQGSAANSLIADVTTFIIPGLFTAFGFPHELPGAIR